MSERELLRRTAEIAADYIETLGTRPIRPDRRYQEMFELLDRPLPDRPSEPMAVVEELASSAAPGLDVARTVAAFARAAG